MGSTVRHKPYQIPMPTRSTDVSMINQCPGRWFLTQLREDEQKDASFFILGDVLHRVIEATINEDWDRDEALRYLGTLIEASPNTGIETSSRGFDSMLADGTRMVHNWFRFVHPDSGKRHPIYDEYHWPPRLEVEFLRDVGTRYPVWGRVDAVFPHKVDDSFMIVDWKSGNQRPSSDFQLQFYRFGLDLPHAVAHFHMLDRVRQPSIVVEAEDYPGDTELLRMVTEVENYKSHILTGGMPQFRPDWYCNYCPVQHLCPVEGDVRNRDKNLTELKRLLPLAEPLGEVLSLPGDADSQIN